MKPALAAAAALALIAMEPTGEANRMLRNASAADTPSAAERRATRLHEAKLRVMNRTNREAIVWGNEKRPNGTIVLTLSPALKKTGGTDIVEVELFSTFVDDDGSTELGCRARELTLATWWPSIEKAGVPVHLVHRQVDEGPGLDSHYHESRRNIGELVTGGAWYGANGDERGVKAVNATMERLREYDTLREVTQADVEQILTGAKIDPGKWRSETRERLETTRARDNARWQHIATQTLEWTKWTRRVRLGTGASPIVVIDGRYLVTMNTIWRQGGLRGTERLFQTVNALVQQQLEKNKGREANNKTTDKQEKTMNYTAAALTAATVLLASCAPTSYDPENPQPWRGGWKVEGGKVEILPDAAHLRMKRSGRVLRIISLEPLEGEEASKARMHIEQLTKDREVTCGWPHGWGTENNPMAISEQGYPIASCKLVEAAQQASCTQASCFLGYRVLRAGYGKYAAGAWKIEQKGASDSWREKGPQLTRRR